jgi:hypothetical protein
VAEDKHMRAIQEATEEAARRLHRLGAGKSNQVSEIFEGQCIKCRLTFTVKGTRVSGQLLDVVCRGSNGRARIL